MIKFCYSYKWTVHSWDVLYVGGEELLSLHWFMSVHGQKDVGTDPWGENQRGKINLFMSIRFSMHRNNEAWMGVCLTVDWILIKLY